MTRIKTEKETTVECDFVSHTRERTAKPRSISTRTHRGSSCAYVRLTPDKRARDRLKRTTSTREGQMEHNSTDCLLNDGLHHRLIDATLYCRSNRRTHHHGDYTVFPW